MEKTLSIFTLGCKVNRYDSEAIEETFIKAGYKIVPFDQKAAVYIVNTCTVTHMSDRKSRQMIRRTKKINPDAILAVIGCYAQGAKEEIEAMEEVDLVIGTNGRIHVLEAVEDYRLSRIPMNFVGDIMEVSEFEELKVNNMRKMTRAYLKIQEGCNNYCSYCIIPYVRGNIRSRKPENILSEVKILAQEGFKEIVLTGIHVASYGKDLKNTNLIEIIQQVHQVDGIERIRLSSIEPNVVTDEFVAAISALPKVCHHFHLSLQSGSDTVLKRMNRKYDSAHYKQAVEFLREKLDDIAFTTDIIVGFPGETQEEFDQTVAFVKEIRFSDIHIFPYSPRAGTPAATMEDQVCPEVKSQRVKILTEVVAKIQAEILEAYLGKTVEVLFEQNYKKDLYEGHTSNYIKVRAQSKTNLENKIEKIKIKSMKDQVLYGDRC